MMDIDVMVGLHGPLEEAAATIGRLLGIVFHPLGRRPAFSADYRGAMLTLGGHELVNDRELEFEAYSYDLDVEAATQREQDAIGRQVFDVLRIAGVPCMLVRNVETKIDEYRPGG